MYIMLLWVDGQVISLTAGSAMQFKFNVGLSSADQVELRNQVFITRTLSDNTLRNLSCQNTCLLVALVVSFQGEADTRH